MHIAKVANCHASPCYLLRETYREDGKAKNRTLANLCRLPIERIDTRRAALRGDPPVPVGAHGFEIRRSLPHGHVLAGLTTPSLVSGRWHVGSTTIVLRWVRWPPDPARGDRRPSTLRPQPDASRGTCRRCVTHNRTVARSPLSRARSPVAWTRQVTVTEIFCGVDVGSETLDARVGRNGAWKPFANTAQEIAGLAAFCQRSAWW